MERFRSQCVDTMPRDDRSSSEKLVFLLSYSVSVFWFNVGRFPNGWIRALCYDFEPDRLAGR